MIFDSFAGGMNLFDVDTGLPDTSYGLAYNIRNRQSCLTPVNGPLLVDAPAGLKQGIYAFDNYLVLFVSGQAFYKNILTDSAWTQIADFALSPDAEFLYAEAVPAAFITQARKLIDAEQTLGSSANPSVAFESTSGQSTSAGLVVQDGINVPFIILPDATCRRLGTFRDWMPDNREYVPVMKQMAFHMGILFGVARDGKTIYRSVTGRPLDFVVNVTVEGFKGGAAESTSHAVGYDNITCLKSLPTGELLVANTKSCVMVELNYETTIFAEPTFRNTRSFRAGIINQHSFLATFLGGRNTYYFIDLDGLRSFDDSLGDDRNENRNSAFTAYISNGLDVKQSAGSAVSFDNYSLFSVKSIYDNDENLVAVFDNLRQSWVCFDDYNIPTIKQFAVASQSAVPKLYAITAGEVYQIFGGEVGAAYVELKALTPGSPATRHMLRKVNLTFIDSANTGIVSARANVNGEDRDLVRENLRVTKTEQISLNFFSQSTLGWKIKLKLSWNTNGKLVMVETEHNVNTSTPQPEKRYVA